MKKTTIKRPLAEADILPVLKKIGEKMQGIRKEKGYKNLEIFAYENELPRAQYGRYERGQDLKVSSLLKVLHALDISASEFFKDLESK